MLLKAKGIQGVTSSGSVTVLIIWLTTRHTMVISTDTTVPQIFKLCAGRPYAAKLHSASAALDKYGLELSSTEDTVLPFVLSLVSSGINWATVVQSLPESLRSYTYGSSGIATLDSRYSHPWQRALL